MVFGRYIALDNKVNLNQLLSTGHPHLSNVQNLKCDSIYLYIYIIVLGVV